MGNEALAGQQMHLNLQLVLERLDFLIDSRAQKLVPRHPEIVSVKAK